MKKTLALAAIAAITIAIVGCANQPGAKPGAPINVSPQAAVTGQFNLGTWNPALVVEAASYCPQVGSIDASGMGVNFHWARNAPPGYVPHAMGTPPADRLALMRADALASQVIALSTDTSSDDVSISGGGIVVVIHMAYPPSVLNATQASWITNVVVTPESVITNVVPGQTNTVISQVIKTN
jgi:hypothetical protein